MTFSPSGSHLLVEGASRDAALFELPSGRQIAAVGTLENPLRAAAFSSDGALLVTAGEDGLGRVWETRSGAQRLTLRGHLRSLRSVAVSVDGAVLVTGGDDGSVRVWQSSNGTEKHRLELRATVAERLALSPDGRRLLSLALASVPEGEAPIVTPTPSGDNAPQGTVPPPRVSASLQLWNLENANELMHLDEAVEPPKAFGLSPDGHRFWTKTQRSGLALWDTADGQRVLSVPVDAARLATVAFSPDGTTLLTTDPADTRIWNASTGSMLRRIELRASNEAGFTLFSPDGKHIFGTAPDAGDSVFSTDTGERELQLRGNAGGVIQALFSPDAKRLLTIGRDNAVRLWELEGGELLETFRGHAATVYDARIAGDGGRIVTASRDGTLRFWGDRGGVALHSLHSPLVEFSPDGAKLLLAGTNTARVLDAHTGSNATPVGLPSSGTKVLRFWPDGNRATLVDRRGGITVWDFTSANAVFSNPAEPNSKDLHAAVSRDGQRVVLADSDGHVRTWDAAANAELGRFDAELYNANHVEISPDGSRILFQASEGAAQILDLRTGQVLARLGGEDTVFSDLCWTPDGTKVITAGSEEPIKLWDGRSGQLLESIEDFALGLSVSPDGERLAVVLEGEARAAGGTQEFVRVWELRSKRIVSTLDGHPGSISTVRFSPDGTRLVTAGDDRTARLWDAASGRLLATLVGQNDDVVSADFSPDGLLVRTVGSEGASQFFPATPQGFLAVGCKVLRSVSDLESSVRAACEAAQAALR